MRHCFFNGKHHIDIDLPECVRPHLSNVCRNVSNIVTNQKTEVN